MGVRAIRARIECDRETLVHLWRTHCVFNKRLPSLITKLFAMRRGEVGTGQEQKDLYQRAARFTLARDAKDAPYLLNSVCIKGWKPATALKMKARVRNADGTEQEVTGESWANEAAELSNQGTLLFEKEQMRDGLPDSLFQPLIRDAVAYINGHNALVHNWEAEHAEWLKKKAEWETKDEHKKYLALHPRFAAFEEAVGGKAGKRRGRWHLYLNWLRENPDLTGWRGGQNVVHALDTNAQARIARAKPWKKRSVEAEEFWKANPELAALDRLHGYYEREFVRRRKTKKNPDGFDHRPTFTMPDPVLHPRWVHFNAPQTSPNGYNELKLPDARGECGSVRLRLLNGERIEGGWPNTWVTLRFRSDPRLALFSEQTITTQFKKGKKKGEETSKKQFFFSDRQLNCVRPAQISGAKLIFKFKNVKRLQGILRTGTPTEIEEAIPHLVTPYLVFACTIEDMPLTDKARAIQWTETGEVTKTGKKRKAKKLPEKLVTCAVDLGLRNLGFVTVATADQVAPGGVRVLRSRNQWIGAIEGGGKHAGRWSEGPDLAHIGIHKREIRRLRRLRGKPVKREKSHIGLQEHITNMGEDRFKKAARAIVNLALNANQDLDKTTGEPYPRADVLILEKLAGFIPDAERERGINRALVNWNRGQLVTRIKEMAKDAGLKVFEVHPAGTSQCCSKCGALGRRYSIVRADETGTPVIHFGWVEKLFACPDKNCAGRDPHRTDRPFTCNADHNASINLQRVFVMNNEAVKSFFQWKVKTNASRESDLRAIDDALRPALERLHRLHSGGVDAPF